MNCYNGEKYIREAVDSVINQTYENWELIFWDNQSSDSSAKLFLEYDDCRLKYFYAQKHTELGDARVEAMSKAKGSWVGILDVDDIWCKEKLEYQVDIINKSLNDGVELGLVYGKVLEINERGVEVGELSHINYKNKILPNGMILKELLLKGNFIMSPSILFSMNAFKQIGGFPIGYLNASDYYISCAISSIYRVGVVNKYVAKYREHQNNLTLNQKVIAFEEQLMIFNKWVKYVDVDDLQKIKRIRELNVMIAFMEMKYKNNYIRGVKLILLNGSFLLAIKIVIKYLFSKYRAMS
ncbi:glycosyltransferase [Candidatus Pelagibacter sp.]|nr:glycosyltransferase [Candidatus Pelagibacter sp.]